MEAARSSGLIFGQSGLCERSFVVLLLISQINRLLKQKETVVYAYCLFCETQRCKIIADYISVNYGYICLSPQIIQRKWVKGVPVEEKHDWLPGYLFLYLYEQGYIRFDISGIIRYLGEGPLEGQDRTFAEMVFETKGVLGNVSLIQENGRYVIHDPVWEKLKGQISKIDRERKRCCVSYEFDNTNRTVWVGYEIINKQQTAFHSKE